MVLCPIALAVGCRKCPIFKVCPVKSVIGDYHPPAPEPEPERKSRPAASKSSGKKARSKRGR